MIYLNWSLLKVNFYAKNTFRIQWLYAWLWVAVYVSTHAGIQFILLLDNDDFCNRFPWRCGNNSSSNFNTIMKQKNLESSSQTLFRASFTLTDIFCYFYLLSFEAFCSWWYFRECKKHNFSLRERSVAFQINGHNYLNSSIFKMWFSSF